MEYDASRVALYRQHAAECARLAQNVPEPGLREAYVDLQLGWLRLADELEQEAQRSAAGEEADQPGSAKTA
jgi:hypothetical protein